MVLGDIKVEYDVTLFNDAAPCGSCHYCMTRPRVVGGWPPDMEGGYGYNE